MVAVICRLFPFIYFVLNLVLRKHVECVSCTPIEGLFGLLSLSLSSSISTSNPHARIHLSNVWLMQTTDSLKHFFMSEVYVQFYVMAMPCLWSD